MQIIMNITMLSILFHKTSVAKYYAFLINGKLSRKACKARTKNMTLIKLYQPGVLGKDRNCCSYLNRGNLIWHQVIK